MKFIKWFLGIIFFMVIVTAVGGYIFLKNFDLNRYKAMAEKIAYEKTGRKLVIAGDANLGISLIPTIVINDISFANPEWAKNPQMAKIETLELRFALLPLLKKQIIVEKALLKRPQVYLETAKDGQNSWDIKLPQTDKTMTTSHSWFIKSAYAAENDNPLDFLSEFTAREVALQNGVVEYYQHKDNSSQKLDINELNFDTEDINSPMNASWDLAFNGMKFEGEGIFGSLATLFSATGEYPIDVDMKALNVKAVISAKIKNLMNDKLSATFDCNVYNPAGNFNAPETTLIGNGNATLKKVDFDIKTLNVVNNVLRGNVSADISGKKPMIIADLRGDIFDLRNFNTAKPTAWNFELVKSAQASALVPNEAIPFELLQIVDANANIKLGKLVVDNEIALNNLAVKAVLNNGVLNVKPLIFELGGGKADISAIVNAVNNSVTVIGATNDVILPEVLKILDANNSKTFGFLSGGKTQTSFNLSGSGATYRTLINNLNGQVIAIVEASKMQSGNFKYLNGNFINQLLNILKLDTAKVENFDLTCAVVRADIKDGVASFPKGIAIDSDKIDFVSNGTVNLKNDKLNLTLNAYGSGIVDVSLVQALSNLVKIRGTIQSPSITVDQGGAIKTIAGVALSGGTFAGAQMLLDKDAAPCYTALSGTSFQNKFPKPTGVTNAAQKTYQGTSEAIDNSAAMIKNSAKEIKNLGKDLLNNFLK